MKNRIKSFALRHITSLCIGFALVFMLFVTGGMIRSIKQNLDNIRKISVVTGDSRYSLADIPVIAVGENFPKEFLIATSKKIVGKESTKEMDASELTKVAEELEKLQEQAEGTKQ